MQRYVKENNLILIKEYVDDGISGTTFDRPGFNEMLQDIENKTINMVVTKDLLSTEQYQVCCNNRWNRYLY